MLPIRYPNPPVGPFLLGTLVACAAGCGGDEMGPAENPVPSQITVAPSSIVFDAWGESRNLSATVLDQNGQALAAPVTWVSDGYGIADVSATGVVISVSNGATTVRATAGSVSADVAVAVDAAGPYNIELVFIGTVSGAQRQAIRAAELRWEHVIQSELTAVSFATNQVPPGSCFTTQPLISDLVDDIRIYIDVAAIDGVGGLIAGSQPCIIRTGSLLPAVGVVHLDAADIGAASPQDIETLSTHEIGHALGIGSLWTNLNLLVNPAVDDEGADAHFNGPRAIAAFDAAGGTTYVGEKVPVQNTGGVGTADRHWREDVFGLELMSPALVRGELNPLSLVTIESLADLGYEVDLSAADSYALPPTTPAAAARPRGFRLDIDRIRYPVRVVDSTGKVVRIIPR